jgi:hypothetical protein
MDAAMESAEAGFAIFRVFEIKSPIFMILDVILDFNVSGRFSITSQTMLLNRQRQLARAVLPLKRATILPQSSFNNVPLYLVSS